MAAREDERLSQIATRWSLLRQAHAPDDDARRAAQAELLGRAPHALPSPRRYRRPEGTREG
jgi:hypothetical protein